MERKPENNAYFTGLQKESISTLVLKILCVLYGNVWNEYDYVAGFHRISLLEMSLEAN